MFTLLFLAGIAAALLLIVGSRRWRRLGIGLLLVSVTLLVALYLVLGLAMRPPM